MVSLFFLSLNIPPMAFFFLHVHCLLINVSSLKLIRPIITRLFVPYKSTWKHFMSSLWMNVTYFISWLLHIVNLLSLVILTPPRLPYIPFANCAHLFTSCVNSFADCDISKGICFIPYYCVQNFILKVNGMDPSLWLHLFFWNLDKVLVYHFFQYYHYRWQPHSLLYKLHESGC